MWRPPSGWCRPGVAGVVLPFLLVAIGLYILADTGTDVAP
jgi:hypothetical protein